MADRPAVRIRPTTRADLPALVALWNDGRVMRWVGYPNGLGMDERAASDWFARLVADPGRRHFLLEADAVGFAGELYAAIDVAHRRAGLDIKLRPEAQGRGLATAGLEALVALVLGSEPDVDELWVEPSAANERARRLYARCGFAPAPRPADLPSAESFWVRRRRPAGGGLRQQRRT